MPPRQEVKPERRDDRAEVRPAINIAGDLVTTTYYIVYSI